MVSDQLCAVRQVADRGRRIVGRGEHETTGAFASKPLKGVSGRDAPVDHHRRHRCARCRLDGALPSWIDDQEIDQRPDDAIDLGDSAPARVAGQLVEGSTQRLSACSGTRGGLLSPLRRNLCRSLS